MAKYRLVSLDTRTTSKARRPRELYLERLEKRGFPPPIHPHGEMLLAEKVKPHKMDLIQKRVEIGTTNKMLDMLEKKWLAVTWMVPDNIHKQVVEELRQELAGKTLEYTYENFLLVWKIEDLSDKIPYL